MTEAVRGGVQMHALSGHPNRDFLPGGFELCGVALPTEPKAWVPLSRGECLLLAMALRRAVSKQPRAAVGPERRLLAGPR